MNDRLVYAAMNIGQNRTTGLGMTYADVCLYPVRLAHDGQMFFWAILNPGLSVPTF